MKKRETIPMTGDVQQPLRILMIEDRPLHAALVKGLLLEDELSCDITQVSSREDFVAALQKRTFDVILTDYAFPGFDGLTALALVRDIDQDVPVILVSGVRGEEFAVEALKAGAADYVRKTDLSRLSFAIRRALREREERQRWKHAETTLREHMLLFQRLAEIIPAAIFISCGSKFLYVNPAVEALSGYSRKELLTMDFWEMVHPDFREIVKTRGLVRQRGHEASTNYEIKIETKNKETRWLSLGLGVVRFGGQRARLGTAIDITERKQAEDALQTLSRL